MEDEHRHVAVGHDAQLHRPTQQPILAAPEHCLRSWNVHRRHNISRDVLCKRCLCASKRQRCPGRVELPRSTQPNLLTSRSLLSAMRSIRTPRACGAATAVHGGAAAWLV